MPAAGSTIFALSSGAPPQAIAVLRVSGPEAFTALARLTPAGVSPRMATLRTLRHPHSGEPLDQALVLTFPGPRSATGDDVVELHLHGGRAVVRAVEAALAEIDGLRRAEPGEFTRRALTNGRIDVNQAEGLADLLAAETEAQRRAAQAMADGHFSALVEAWRERLVDVSALVEADLDFADEADVGDGLAGQIHAAIDALLGDCTAMLDLPRAELLRDGVRVVLAGPPNSGKSALYNALLQKDAAIVTPIPGTTRDVLAAPLAFAGIPFVVVDTAGLRDRAGDPVEAMGMARAAAEAAHADILLWLGPQGTGPSGPALIEIDAKSDIPDRIAKDAPAIAVSALSGAGLGTLVECLVTMGGDLLPLDTPYALNQRQRASIAAISALLAEAAGQDDSLIVGELLRAARGALDRLTGRAGTEDLLDALFGRFCIGK